MNAIDKLKALSEQLADDNYHAESDQLDAIIAELTQDDPGVDFGIVNAVVTNLGTLAIDLEQRGFKQMKKDHRQSLVNPDLAYGQYIWINDQHQEIAVSYLVDGRNNGEPV